MKSIHELRKIVEIQLASQLFPDSPSNLYDPIKYILKIGGKRTRPTLTLISHQLFDNDIKRSYLPALAIELFHNFTLIHDDIMDNASLRRNMLTVHKKWDKNTAILSGDAMLIESYKLLAKSESDILSDLLFMFNKMSIKVCEGQQLDMDFQNQKNVSVLDYLKMIEYKTAYLIASSLSIGGLTARTTKKNINALFKFGINIGIAFQLKDDLLDSFGTSDFGKLSGGDILMNKKTILYLKAIEISNAKQRDELLYFYKSLSGDEKIKKVTKLYEKLEIPNLVQQIIKGFHSQALSYLDLIESNNKEPLYKFAEELFDRKS